MSKNRIEVPSFSVDHTKLDAGVHLSFTDDIHQVKVWDLRFYAPRDKKYITPEAMHTIEHLLAFKLRYYLGSDYVWTSPYGCCTGFGLITDIHVDRENIIKYLIDLIDNSTPICDISEIPAFTEKECGQPLFVDIDGANQALEDYCQTLKQLL